MGKIDQKSPPGRRGGKTPPPFLGGPPPFFLTPKIYGKFPVGGDINLRPNPVCDYFADYSVAQIKKTKSHLKKNGKNKNLEFFKILLWGKNVSEQKFWKKKLCQNRSFWKKQKSLGEAGYSAFFLTKV